MVLNSWSNNLHTLQFLCLEIEMCLLDQIDLSNVPKEKKNVPKIFKVCPKNFQISPSNVPKSQLAKKKSKSSPFDVAPIKFYKLESRKSSPSWVCPKENVPKLSPKFSQPQFFLYLKIPKHKKNSTARKNSFKSVAKHEKKWKHKMKIESHPLFSPLVPIFQFSTPSFSNFMKIRKEGTKSKEGTGLDAGPGRTLQKTFLYQVLP